MPKKYRRGRRTLIRTDSEGGTHDFVAWLTRRAAAAVLLGRHGDHRSDPQPRAQGSSLGLDAGRRGGRRDPGRGLGRRELAGDVLNGCLEGMRLIVRMEQPYCGAQLRLTDAEGMRLTCFATNTVGRPIVELELRQRLRARAGDRIRAARSTGLRNLPLKRIGQNRIWLEIVQITLDLLAWMPLFALTGKARLWEPRRLRLRLFTAAGQLVATGRRRFPRLARHWPWTSHITAALKRLALLPNPG